MFHILFVTYIQTKLSMSTQRSCCHTVHPMHATYATTVWHSAALARDGRQAYSRHDWWVCQSYLDCLLLIAAALAQRLLAVHHASASLLAKAGHRFGTDARCSQAQQQHGSGWQDARGVSETTAIAQVQRKQSMDAGLRYANTKEHAALRQRNAAMQQHFNRQSCGCYTIHQRYVSHRHT
jgi:hypothetical protein